MLSGGEFLEILKLSRFFNFVLSLKAVVRLSGGKLKEECSNLKTKSYVCADRKTTLNNIQAGKRLVQIEVAERVEKLDNNQGLYMLVHVIIKIR